MLVLNNVFFFFFFGMCVIFTKKMRVVIFVFEGGRIIPLIRKTLYVNDQNEPSWALCL